MTAEQAFSRLASLCARAEYCAADLAAKMERWDIPQPEQTEILRRLADEKYIDEERYSRLFARDKLRFNRWGRVKIRMALAAKRIGAEAVEAAIDGLDESEYTDVLLQLLRTKARSVAAADGYERDMKLLRFAAGHGFTADEIRRCLPYI